MVAGILIFSVIASVLSFFFGRQGREFAGGELALYVLLVAWGSMFFGLFVAGL